MTPDIHTCAADILPDQLSEVCAVIADCFEISREQLTAETRLREDLGVDSIDKLTLALALEEEFDVVIADEALYRIRTIGEAASSIASALVVRRIGAVPLTSREHDTERSSK